MDAILGSIYSLLITLVGAIYNLVATVFELFSMLSKVTTIDKNVYGNIIENFYLLIGVVMLFIIAFYLLKAMINPDDNKETSSGGKIVKNFITSVIILLILPTIFNFAFSFQFAIVDYNTIGRMFGYNNSADTMASAGNSMANSVFTAFFTPSREQCPTGDFDECAKDITSGEDKLSTVISNVNKTGYFTSYSKFGDNVAKNEIDFNFLIALIAGLYLVYVIFSFCLDLGVRLVKLVFYQIIAPIPVFLRVVPEGKLSNTFNDWVKITITCYLEVFIRLFIIFFGVYLISAFTSNEGLGSFLNVGSGFLGLMAKVIIILGVITFIKQAPKLIGDIFGFDSSNMKLGLREKLAAGGLFAAGAAVGGAAISTVRNLRKFKGEFKGKSKAEKFTNGMRMLKGGAAGIIGGGYRGFKAGNDAKSFSEMKSGISSAVNETTAKQDERNDLFSRGGNTIIGGYKAKSNDKKDSIKEFWLGSQEQANVKINAYDELIGLNDSAKKSAKSLVEKGKKMSEDQLQKKYGDAVASKIQSSKVAELEYEVAQKQLDAAINSDKNNVDYDKQVQKARERVMETKDAMGKVNKDAEDFITEMLYAKKDAWDNFNADLKIDLSNGRVAADKVRVKLQSPEFSSEVGVVNAGITPDTVNDIGYKFEIPVLDEHGNPKIGADGKEIKVTQGIKQALDNLEIEKGKLATESAIYNETHKNSNNK